MDARVTKQRLGNMLSYDWLKILCTIAAAVVGLVLFFTMVRVRPARAQQFSVHFYGDYSYGADYARLSNVLDFRLSYDVLQVRTEKFGGDVLDGASYTARRSTGDGSVALAADYAAGEGESSPFRSLVTAGLSNPGTVREDLNMFYHADEYFAGLERYLVRFFGEDWRGGQLDAAEAEKCFRARNVEGPNNKNRYRSDAQIAAGVEDEKKRLETLRSDYAFLLDHGLGEEDGFPYVTYVSHIKLSESETEEHTYVAGVSLKKLTRLTSLVYYEENGKPVSDKMNFLIYNNGASSFEDGTNDGRDDLKYEAVTFLKYLVEQYA